MLQLKKPRLREWKDLSKITQTGKFRPSISTTSVFIYSFIDATNTDCVPTMCQAQYWAPEVKHHVV